MALSETRILISLNSSVSSNVSVHGVHNYLPQTTAQFMHTEKSNSYIQKLKQSADDHDMFKGAKSACFKPYS